MPKTETTRIKQQTAENRAKKEQAFELFFDKKLTRKRIAELLEKPEQTIGRWIKEFKKSIKNGSIIVYDTDEVLDLQNITLLKQHLNKLLKSPKVDVDEVSSLTNAIYKLESISIKKQTQTTN